jgi:hypothetical protein
LCIENNILLCKNLKTFGQGKVTIEYRNNVISENSRGYRMEKLVKSEIEHRMPFMVFDLLYKYQ